MSWLQAAVIGALLIALVQGQYDFNSNDPTPIEQGSYENNERSSEYDGQQLQVIDRNAAEQRFKTAYNLIRGQLANYQKQVAELENTLNDDGNDYSENGNNEIEGYDSSDENDMQKDNASPLSNGYGDNTERERRRSFWKRFKNKLGGISRKAGHIGKQFLGSFLGGGGGGGAVGGASSLGSLAGLGKLFGRRR